MVSYSCCCCGTQARGHMALVRPPLPARVPPAPAAGASPAAGAGAASPAAAGGGARAALAAAAGAGLTGLGVGGAAAASSAGLSAAATAAAAAAARIAAASSGAAAYDNAAAAAAAAAVLTPAQRQQQQLAAAAQAILTPATVGAMSKLLPAVLPLVQTPYGLTVRLAKTVSEEVLPAIRTLLGFVLPHIATNALVRRHSGLRKGGEKGWCTECVAGAAGSHRLRTPKCAALRARAAHTLPQTYPRAQVGNLPSHPSPAALPPIPTQPRPPTDPFPQALVPGMTPALATELQAALSSIFILLDEADRFTITANKAALAGAAAGVAAAAAAAASAKTGAGGGAAAGAAEGRSGKGAAAKGSDVKAGAASGSAGNGAGGAGGSGSGSGSGSGIAGVGSGSPAAPELRHQFEALTAKGRALGVSARKTVER